MTNLRTFVLLIPLLLIQILPGITAQAQQQANPVKTDQEVLTQFLNVLKDDAARAKLIESLEKATGPVSANDKPEAQPAVAKTVATKLATLTKTYVDDTVLAARSFVFDIYGMGTALAGPNAINMQKVTAALFPLLSTIAATQIIWWSFGLLFRRLLAPLKRRMINGNMFSTVLLIASYTLASLFSLAIAYALGSVLAVAWFGAEGESLYQALYLNAFIIFGCAMIVIRLFTGVVDNELGILDATADQRAVIRKRAAWIAGVLIFGIAFVVPALNVSSAFALARGVRVLVFTAAALFAVLMIRKLVVLFSTPSEVENGNRVGDARVQNGDESATSGQGVLARALPWIAYAYVAFAYVIALTRPLLFVDYVGGATLKTVAVLLAGVLILRAMAKLSKKQINAPEFWLLDSEQLSRRLSSMIPVFLRLAWFIVAICVAAVVVDAWKIIDIGGWVASDSGAAMTSGVLSAFFVLLAVGLIWAFVTSWIDQQITDNSGDALHGGRKRTLYSLARSALTVMLVAFGGMIALSELGVNIGPLLAGAGVLGLAVGFGAQKLVQDIISGVFIQLENAMNVGDVVQLGGTTGTVEHLTLRSASLRDLNGVFHIIPFSSMDTVSNYMRGFSYHVSDVGIAYKEKVADGKEAMVEAFERLKATDFVRDIIAPLEMHGVTRLGDSAVTIRARIKTIPGKQFALGRAYTELLKEVMDERNIEIPFPHTTLVLGRDKEGNPDTFQVKNDAAKPEVNKSGRKTEKKAVSAS